MPKVDRSRRTEEPSKSQWKDGELRRSGRKEVKKKRWKKKKKEKRKKKKEKREKEKEKENENVRNLWESCFYPESSPVDDPT